jgi:hypothetical protein
MITSNQMWLFLGRPCPVEVCVVNIRIDSWPNYQQHTLFLQFSRIKMSCFASDRVNMVVPMAGKHMIVISFIEYT